jgi:hypothetical protein
LALPFFHVSALGKKKRRKKKKKPPLIYCALDENARDSYELQEICYAKFREGDSNLEKQGQGPSSKI